MMGRLKLDTPQLQLKRELKIGAIAIRVISAPMVDVKQLQGILMTEEQEDSTDIVRDLRVEDYAREERRLCTA